ncbi:MAG TPA: TolC family protein [Vicinamibacterales bacterium]|nr:TolC family protein [Vicinamibacterales bacterium]
MTRNRSIGAAAAVLVLAAGLGTPAGAQQVSEARIRELIKQATDPATRAQTPSPAQPGTGNDRRASVALTLDDAVKFALDRNLDIAVQRLNPEINDIAYASIKSVYHPNLTSTLAAASQSNPANSAIAGSNTPGAAIDSTIDTYNGGIAQSIPWGGGSATITLNNNRNTTTSLNTLYNPYYNTNWSAAYTQPLFRNFSIDATRRQLRVTKINRDISDVQLRATITNTVSNVRNAYWDYVFAVQSVEVAKQSLDLAERLVRDNQTRVEVGTMAPIDVVQAQSQAATARQNLVAAQSTMRTSELVLKRLIVGGTNDPNWGVRLDPVDRPEFTPQTFDIEAAVRRALSERTDLEIAKKNIEANDVTLKYLVDQMRPQADVLATYGVVGLGGTQLLKAAGGGVNAAPIGFVPGGYLDALSPLFRNAFPRWTVQLNFSYPLGVSAQEANVARARVQLNQIQAQTKQIELQVATDVTNATLTAQSNTERVQAAQAARELAQKQLEAEQSKFEVGMSTNFNVIQAQRDLANAQNNELQAILNYRKSLVELERLQQTTLQNLNITVISATGAAGGTGGGQ